MLRLFIMMVVRVFIVAYVALCVFMCVRLATGAPAPPAAPPKKAAPTPPAFIGTWRLHWSGSQGDVVFAKDNGYWCLWNGSQYVGWWKLSEGNVLIVNEGKIPDQPDSVPTGMQEWKIKLDAGQLAGNVINPDGTTSSRAFRLVPVDAEELKAPKTEK